MKERICDFNGILLADVLTDFCQQKTMTQQKLFFKQSNPSFDLGRGGTLSKQAKYGEGWEMSRHDTTVSRVAVYSISQTRTLLR